MKKAVLTISIIILIICIPIIIIRLIPIKPFYLSDKYYEKYEIKEISKEELDTLTKNEESFALLIYQPMCLVSSSFTKIVEDYGAKNGLIFYKIAFNEIKNTDLNKKIKYYPSFVLYKEGKVKKYLDANKNSDIEYFSSEKGFKEWFTKYIKLKNPERTDYETSENNNTNEETNNDKIVLKDVTKEEGKVNIYFFWGNGCPHCKEEFRFLSEIEEEYGSMFNLYTYETWYNEDNAKMAKTFGKALDFKVKGVPFTIIGSKPFSGFGEEQKDKMKKAIEEESKNNFDVYFDKILNTNN